MMPCGVAVLLLMVRRVSSGCGGHLMVVCVYGGDALWNFSF